MPLIIKQKLWGNKCISRNWSAYMLREAHVYFQVTETRFTTVPPLPLGARVWSVEDWQAGGTEHERACRNSVAAKGTGCPWAAVWRCSQAQQPSTTGPWLQAQGSIKTSFLKKSRGVHGQMNPSYPGRSPSEHHVPSVLENDWLFNTWKR